MINISCRSTFRLRFSGASILPEQLQGKIFSSAPSQMNSSVFSSCDIVCSCCLCFRPMASFELWNLRSSCWNLTQVCLLYNIILRITCLLTLSWKFQALSCATCGRWFSWLAHKETNFAICCFTHKNEVNHWRSKWTSASSYKFKMNIGAPDTSLGFWDQSFVPSSAIEPAIGPDFGLPTTSPISPSWV